MNLSIKYKAIFLPASMEYVTSILAHIALVYLPPSLFMMVRGGVVLITAGLSKVFLKKKLFNFHYSGCLAIFLGILIVGLGQMIF